jgi:hypothetical protein
VSEYQYYEFLALDRPLNATEKAYVQTLSSRVELTLTQANEVALCQTYIWSLRS